MHLTISSAKIVVILSMGRWVNWSRNHTWHMWWFHKWAVNTNFTTGELYPVWLSKSFPHSNLQSKSVQFLNLGNAINRQIPILHESSTILKYSKWCDLTFCRLTPFCRHPRVCQGTPSSCPEVTHLPCHFTKLITQNSPMAKYLTRGQPLQGIMSLVIREGGHCGRAERQLTAWLFPNRLEYP